MQHLGLVSFRTQVTTAARFDEANDNTWKPRTRPGRQRQDFETNGKALGGNLPG
jgi:hypothetical protein